MTGKEENSLSHSHSKYFTEMPISVQWVRNMVLLLAPALLQQFLFPFLSFPTKFRHKTGREQDIKPDPRWLCLRFQLLPLYTTHVQLLLSLLSATCQAHSYLIVCPLAYYQMNPSSFKGWRREVMLKMMMCKSEGLGFENQLHLPLLIRNG